MSDSDDDDDIAYMALVALLSDELEAPNRPRLSLACLPAFPKLESDWARIYRHGDSRSFVKLMMIDRPAFNKLLSLSHACYAIRQALCVLQHGRQASASQADSRCSPDGQQEDDG